MYDKYHESDTTPPFGQWATRAANQTLVHLRQKKEEIGI